MLKNVKASHQIDLAYLYYLPFCAVFSSRDNFHVQVAPLFMHPAQQFVHGDDLKADLKKLDELYLRLPKETLEEGLYSFAPAPPDDSSYLTTRLWDAYLPAWRKDSGAAAEVSEDIKKALMELTEKYRQATPASHGAVVGTDDLAFAEISRQIKPVKGDYFRIAKDVILKNHEDELKKSSNKNRKIHPPGKQFSGLVEELERLLDDGKCNNIEVILLGNKLDDQGKKIVDGGMYVAEIHSIGIRVLDEVARQFLRQEYERLPLLSMLVLWTRYGAGKLGIMRFLAVSENDPVPEHVDYTEWESKAIAAYLHRHKL
jgi:hypothetical protein